MRILINHCHEVVEVLDVEDKVTLLIADFGEYIAQIGYDLLILLNDHARIARKKIWVLAAVDMINASDSLLVDAGTSADDPYDVVFTY